MLRDLRIENFAIIDRLELSFGGGLNVLTGETGAGKSIVIDAVEVLLGARASADLVRTGCEGAAVEAVFDVEDAPGAARILESEGLPRLADGGVALQREISIAGRNASRVNGRAVPLALMQRLGRALLDIHGQHEHQSLLQRASQLLVLDRYGGADLRAARERYDGLYGRWLKLRRDLTELEGESGERERKVDLLRFQANEIAAARLRAGEEDELGTERRILANAARLQETAAGAFAALYEGDRRPVVDVLGEVQAGLEAAAALDPALKPLAEGVADARYRLEDAARGLREYRDRMQYDPGRLEVIETRLDLLTTLRRKYGATLADVIAFGERAQAEFGRLERAAELAASIRQEIAAVAVELGAAAAELSRLRRAAGDKLGRAVTAELDGLSMAGARFAVALEQEEDEPGGEVTVRPVALGPTGADQAEFLFGPNVGEPPKPLARIASGGEMARVMLAIKTVLADADAVAAMIFDEVDAGIGGRTVQAVAERLARVAAARQVICVTHLPAIASVAESHFVVAKEERDGRVVTLVRRLGAADRAGEIARMLGGSDLTDVTMEHAKKLLEWGARHRSPAAGRGKSRPRQGVE